MISSTLEPHPEINMTIRSELQDALENSTSDGHAANTLTEEIFGRVRMLLHRLNPIMPFLELDLQLADLQRDIREDLFELLRNTVDRDAAVDIIAQRFFFGED
jgi:hypothetical protein